MDSQLNRLLQRAEAVLERIDPLLPALRVAVDWQHVIAARWQREGRGGYLQPLKVSLDLTLADLVGVDAQRDLLARNTRQFVNGLPANHALLWGHAGRVSPRLSVRYSLSMLQWGCA